MANKTFRDNTASQVTGSVTPPPLQTEMPGAAPVYPTPPTQGQTMNGQLPLQPPVDPLTQMGKASALVSRFGRKLAAGNGGETLHKLHKEMTETIEQQNLKDVIKVIIVDKSSANLDVSAIVVAQKVEIAGVVTAAVHTMLVEATAGKLTPVQQNFHGNMIETPICVGDLYNDTFWFQVQRMTMNAFGLKDIRIYEAGASVIHSEIDVENKSQVQQRLSMAIEATDRVLMPSVGGEEAFCVSAIVGDGRTQARVVFNPEQNMTSDGLPIRSDMDLTLSFIENGSNLWNNQQYDPTQRQVDVVSTTNFVNLIYNAQAMPMYGGYQQMQQAPYQAALVTTGVYSQLGQVTMPIFLLGLVLNLTLTRSMDWTNVWRPRLGTPQPNLRDIGAIGYENPHLVQQADPMNPRGARIDTQSTNFDQNALYALIQRAVSPALVYQLLVRERGDDSWLSTIFLQAASAVPEEAVSAQTAIIRAADELTGGRFSQFFTGGPITMDSNNRLHLGYYVNQAGEKRDILDIDYLAVMNMVGDRDIRIATEFDQTNADMSPLPYRMARRMSIITGIVGDFKHKGYARLVTFTPTFLQALAASVHAAGLVINSANQYADGYSMQRGNPMLAQLGLAPQAIMGVNLFQSAGGYGTQMYPGQHWRNGSIYQ